MFCPSCGNKIEINSTSCNNCGQIIAQRTTENNNQTITQHYNRKKFNFLNNIIILITLGLIILVGSFFGISHLLKGNKNQQAATTYFDSNKPIRIKSNNLYGYIDSNGKIIAEPKYRDATQFYDNYAIVKLPKDNENNEYYAIIDKKGKVVLTTTTTYGSSIEFISEYDVWQIEGKLYDKNLKLKTSETTAVDYISNGYFEFTDRTTKEVGIMNTNGKKTYSFPTNGEYVYLSVDISEKDYAELKDDYCSINIENERYGIVNCKSGKLIYEFSTKYISEEDNNVFQIKNKDDFSLIETIYIENDKIAYRSSDNIRLDYIGNNILRIRDNDYRYTYYDIKNKKTLVQKPDSIELVDAWEILTSFKRVKCDEGGYSIKKDDKIIVPCGWDDISFIIDPLYSYAEKKGKQLIFVKKDNKISLYDLKSNKVTENFNTSYIRGNYGDSIFIYYQDSDTKKTIVYNLITGKQKEFDEGISVSNESNYFTTKKDDKIEYYNNDFKLIYTGSVD